MPNYHHLRFADKASAVGYDSLERTLSRLHLPNIIVHAPMQVILTGFLGETRLRTIPSLQHGTRSPIISSVARHRDKIQPFKTGVAMETRIDHVVFPTTRSGAPAGQSQPFARRQPATRLVALSGTGLIGESGCCCAINLTFLADPEGWRR